MVLRLSFDDMAVEFAAAALDHATVSPGRKPGYVDAPRVTVVAGADRNLRSEHLLPRRIVEPNGKIALGVRNAYVEYIAAWVGILLFRSSCGFRRMCSCNGNRQISADIR